MSEEIQRTISEKDLFTGKYISLKALTIENDKNGYAQREIVVHSGSTSILPVTNDRKVILHCEYRKAIEMKSIELYTFKLQSNEDSVEKIKNDFLENDNIPYKNLKIVNKFYSSPSYSTERIFLYYVDIELDSSQLYLENSIKVSVEEAMELIEEEKIVDAKTILALQWYFINKKIWK